MALSPRSLKTFSRFGWIPLAKFTLSLLFLSPALGILLMSRRLSLFSPSPRWPLILLVLLPTTLLVPLQRLLTRLFLRKALEVSPPLPLLITRRKVHEIIAPSEFSQARQEATSRRLILFFFCLFLLFSLLSLPLIFLLPVPVLKILVFAYAFLFAGLFTLHILSPLFFLSDILGETDAPSISS